MAQPQKTKFKPSDYHIATTVDLGVGGAWCASVDCYIELDEYGYVIGRHLLQQDKWGNEFITELVGGVGSSALEQIIKTQLDYDIETCPIIKGRIAEFKAQMLSLRDATIWDRRREERCK